MIFSTKNANLKKILFVWGEGAAIYPFNFLEVGGITMH